MLPLWFNLRGVPVAVVGAGSVARRRLPTLVSEGAAVTVIDPAAQFAPEGCKLVAEPFAPRHLDGARLAFAWALPAVNQLVVIAANARNIWCADGADPDASPMSWGASESVGPLRVAVNTGGSSPTLAARWCRRLAASVPAESLAFIAVVGELRREVQSLGLARPAQESVLRRIASEESEATYAELGFAELVSRARELVASARAGEVVVPPPQPGVGGEPDQHRGEVRPDAGQ